MLLKDNSIITEKQGRTYTGASLFFYSSLRNLLNFSKKASNTEKSRWTGPPITSIMQTEGETTMPEFERLSKKVKEIRQAMNETQFDFADHCGISVDTLSYIERERTDLRLSTIQKIAAYADMTVSELLDVSDNK